MINKGFEQAECVNEYGMVLSRQVIMMPGTLQKMPYLLWKGIELVQYIYFSLHLPHPLARVTTT